MDLLRLRCAERTVVGYVDEGAAGKPNNKGHYCCINTYKVSTLFLLLT